MIYLIKLNTILLGLLDDLSSFRIQLIGAAYIYNLITLYMVAYKGVDYKLAVSAMALLTTVYGAYFVSKHFQAKTEAAQDNCITEDKVDPLKDVS